jgi:hypothetical protein
MIGSSHRQRKAPSPRWGEGWGEGAPALEIIARYTLTQPSPSRERAIAGDGQLAANSFEHSVGVLQHIVVPEADDAVAEALDGRGAGRIDLQGMLPAVEFDRQPRVAAGEICDMGPERELADELGAVQLTAAKMASQTLFGIGAVPPQLARGWRQFLACHGGTPLPNPLPGGEGAVMARHMGKTLQSSRTVNA